jgi:hypothetical protein
MDESVIRVFKDWLGRRTVADSSSSLQSADTSGHGLAQRNVIISLPSREGEKGKLVAEETRSDITQHEDILWFGLRNHVGLRVGVREKKWSGDPSLLLNNEDEVVLYEVEYKGLSSSGFDFCTRGFCCSTMETS